MTVLSAKARSIIDTGVSLLPDKVQRAIWATWANTHQNDAALIETLPQSVVVVALAALETKAQNLRAQREGAPDDEAFYYDNDLSYVRAIENALMRSAAPP